jgi:hypothetical protein
MFGLFKKNTKGVEEIAQDVEILKTKIRVLEVEAVDSQERVLSLLKKISARYDMREIRKEESENEKELKAEILKSGIDINNPQEAIMKVMENPKIMNYAISKLTKELL